MNAVGTPLNEMVDRVDDLIKRHYVHATRITAAWASPDFG